MVIIERSESDNLEFLVKKWTKGTRDIYEIDSVTVIDYSTNAIKVKLPSARYIETYITFCTECFKKDSNFIQEVQNAIQEKLEPAFKFDTSIFSIFFNNYVDHYVLLKVGDNSVKLHHYQT